MENTILKQNLTGRKFLCIGLEENVTKIWSHAFKVMGEYYELKLDFEHENKNNENTLLLACGEGGMKYVDASQFILLDSDEPHVLTNVWISLN